MSRGCAATPNTALPSPIEITMPTAAPIIPPASPSSAASARNNRITRRTDPPIAFINPTSFFRSIATLVIAAITHSTVSISTTATVAVSIPEILEYSRAPPSANWRNGMTCYVWQFSLKTLDELLNLLRVSRRVNLH